MQDTKIREHKEVLRHIAEASAAIRRKHRMIKLGKEIAEQKMSDVFKPVVTPLKELVKVSQTAAKSIKEEPIKDEPMKEEPGVDDSYSTADEGEEMDMTLQPTDEQSESLEQEAPNDYLKLFRDENIKRSDLDNVYGVRELAHQKLMMGDSPISFDNDVIHIGDMTYTKTKGLLELLFKKIPNETYVSSEDIRNYKQIVFATNAHRKFYKAGQPVRELNNSKFKKFVAPPFTVPQPRTGKGVLPKFMVAEEGRGTDYVHWDDPNELVERLRLLLASQAAGNSSHSNEIVSIIEELREAGIIY